MRILLVGGGSGGHVTPLSAVAVELLKNNPKAQIIVLTNRQFLPETQRIFTHLPDTDIEAIFAGKYRRYHGKSLVWHITHLPTLLLNLRDLLYLLIGLVQSMFILLRRKPDVVFCKGGYVCIPVGIVARILGKRIVIHDSDTRPGLTNRILSRWASVIATGMPVSFYPYPKEKMRYIGMPVSSAFKPQKSGVAKTYKVRFGFRDNQNVVLVTGGGNGAQSLNELVAKVAGEWLKLGWGIIHLTGRGKSATVITQRDSLPKELQKYWVIKEFSDMAPCMHAADVVIARTSASTLQEAANAKKVVIGVASPYLEDQKMNAQFFSGQKAIHVVDETTVSVLEFNALIVQYGKNKKTFEEQAQRLHAKFAKPNAAAELARLIEDRP